MGSKRDVPPRTRLSKENLLLRGVPAEYAEGTLEDYVQDGTIKEMFKNYLSNMHDMYEDTINLCLYGANGTGKSFLSSLIVKEAYRLRYKSCMTTVANLIDLTFKPNKTEEDWNKLNLIKTADFLVIDELGKETFNKSLSNVNLVEETLRNSVKIGQVVIICTNSHLEGDGGVYSKYGTSIASLIEGSFVKLEFDDADYRKSVLRKKKALRILEGDED